MRYIISSICKIKHRSLDLPFKHKLSPSCLATQDLLLDYDGRWLCQKETTHQSLNLKLVEIACLGIISQRYFTVMAFLIYCFGDH